MRKDINLLSTEPVKSLESLADIFDIDLDESEDGVDLLKNLKRAIDKGRIFVSYDEDDEPELVVELKKPATMSMGGDKEKTIIFERLRGNDRKAMQNCKDNARGTALHKTIARRTGISIKSVDEMQSTDVGLLESIFNFFL